MSNTARTVEDLAVSHYFSYSLFNKPNGPKVVTSQVAEASAHVASDDVEERRAEAAKARLEARQRLADAKAAYEKAAAEQESAAKAAADRMAAEKAALQKAEVERKLAENVAKAAKADKAAKAGAANMSKSKERPIPLVRKKSSTLTPSPRKDPKPAVATKATSTEAPEDHKPVENVAKQSPLLETKDAPDSNEAV